jgi:hypothetical protein
VIVHYVPCLNKVGGHGPTHGAETQKSDFHCGAPIVTPLPLASLVRDHFLEGLAAGQGDKDWSAVSAIMRRKAGLKG